MLRTGAAIVGILGVGIGMGMAIEHARAQSKLTLADARFEHIGISVASVDKVVEQYATQLQAPYNPVHEIKGSWPKGPGTNYDSSAYVRTTELKLAGMEIHLMQAMGGPSPWKEHFQKRGEGAIEHIAFASKDVKGVADQLLARGGKLLIGDPAKGFCYIQMPDLPFIVELYNDNRK
jgi:hypothetical protein